MPEAIFVIVGGTPDEFGYFETELKHTANQPGVRGRVVFTGHVSDMATVYNGLNVVLSASTSPEPLGTMIIEAMTMARPLIAPDHGGAVEMIDNGKAGLLFRAGDAEDLAAKIRLLHANPELCSLLGQSARTHALKAFSISEHVRRVEQIYERILGSSST